MNLPSPLRCGSVSMGHRCDLPRFHGHRHRSRPHPYETHSWHTDTTRRQTYETDAPWITWTWLSTDRETRITGRSRLRLTCCVCGRTEIVRARIPRWGPVPSPPGGVHPERHKAKVRHAHPDRGHPISWALPLRNLDAHKGGLDLDLLGARIEADLNEAGET